MSFPLLPIVATALLLGVSASAQVPDGSLVVATFSYPPSQPGQAGVWFVDPNTGGVTPVTLTSLPCELRAGCNGSAGSNCVVRDPRSERLLVGNYVLNGGPIGAWLLELQGVDVVASSHCPVGVVPSFDMGVNAAAFLPNGDILLAAGRVTTGANAYSPILRWTPPNPATLPNGAVAAVPLAAQHASVGNLCNALVVDAAGTTAFAVCKNNALFGASATYELLCIPLGGGVGSIVTIATSLAVGEFVTQLWWDCNGDLMGTTARYPLASPGRVLRFRSVGGVWTEQVPTSWPNLFAANAGMTNPATCEMFLNFNAVATTGLSQLYRTNGTATPTAMLAPVPSWGVISGIDINPNPEVFEAPSGLSQPRWSYRPFAGGTPTLGNAQFALPLVANGTGSAFAFLDVARTPGVGILGLDVYLPLPTMTPRETLPLPSPTWPLPLPNNPALLAQVVFVQAAVLDLAGLGASDLLQFTIR